MNRTESSRVELCQVGNGATNALTGGVHRVTLYCTLLLYWRVPMKRIAPLVLGLMALTTTAFGQAPAADFEVALIAAPANLKEGATVIKWKPDYTYDTLKKGTNTLTANASMPNRRIMNRPIT